MLKKQKVLFLLGQIAFIFFIANSSLAQAETFKDPGPILNDAIFPSDKFKADGDDDSRMALGEGVPYGAEYSDTSEFMVGSVSVSIILPESNGDWDYNQENWTKEQEDLVLQEIQNGAAWWKDLNPAANLSFTFHFYSGRTDERAETMYEPINRPSYTVSNDGETLWIDEIMTNFGYVDGDYTEKSRSFINDKRNNDYTNWSFVVFVVNDKDSYYQAFTDGQSAYSNYGGPYMVLTYNNNGYYIENMDSVFAHEMGHSFYALDQYPGAYKDCNARLGYLNYANQNSQYSADGGQCDSDVPSIMRTLIDSFAYNYIDEYAKGQIGWGDKNNNGVPDAVDVAPIVTISSFADTSSGTRYYGKAFVDTKKNKNSYGGTLHEYYGFSKHNITTSSISGIQYQINGGSWQNAAVTKGEFNSISEKFYFTVPDSAGTNPAVQVKALATSGNTATSSLSDMTKEAALIVGSGEGFTPKVQIVDNSGEVTKSFYPYAKAKKEGVKVMACDINGNGEDEIVTSLTYDMVSTIKVFSKSGKKKNSFSMNTEGYNVNLACGDTAGDGHEDIIIATEGGYPLVEIVNEKGDLLSSFLAYDETYLGGVNVAAGDVNNDGYDEIITSSGAGIPSKVKFFRSSGHYMANSYYPYGSSFTGGVKITAGDVNGDGKDEVISVPQTEQNSSIKIYRYSGSDKLLSNFLAYDSGDSNAAIAAGDINADGQAEIITGLAVPRWKVKLFDKDGEKANKDLYPLDTEQTSAYLATGQF
ncbi:MAG: FG-GAP-like repeat-containing protein [Patescibacteria group bacterium]